MRDERFTIWSLQQVLEKIPFDEPVSGFLDMNFSEMAVPYFVKNIFRVSFEYETPLPFDACCLILMPQNKVTPIIIMNKDYEDALKAYRAGDKSNEVLKQCCRRRELYCHETCHLIGIIRAYPSDRSSTAREEFRETIQKKFWNSVTLEKEKLKPFVSFDDFGSSPSVFDKEHFRYGDDSLNYFDLYEELMLPEDKMDGLAKKLCVIGKKNGKISLDDVAHEAFVSQEFFDLFPNKLTRLNGFIAQEYRRSEK